MHEAAVSLGVLVLLALVGLGVLTVIGANKRGAGASVALLEGLVFPLAWVAWYVRDRSWKHEADRGVAPGDDSRTP